MSKKCALCKSEIVDSCSLTRGLRRRLTAAGITDFHLIDPRWCKKHVMALRWYELDQELRREGFTLNLGTFDSFRPMTDAILRVLRETDFKNSLFVAVFENLGVDVKPATFDDMVKDIASYIKKDGNIELAEKLGNSLDEFDEKEIVLILDFCAELYSTYINVVRLSNESRNGVTSTSKTHGKSIHPVIMIARDEQFGKWYKSIPLSSTVTKLVLSDNGNDTVLATNAEMTAVECDFAQLVMKGFSFMAFSEPSLQSIARKCNETHRMLLTSFARNLTSIFDDSASAPFTPVRPASNSRQILETSISEEPSPTAGSNDESEFDNYGWNGDGGDASVAYEEEILYSSSPLRSSKDNQTLSVDILSSNLQAIDLKGAIQKDS